jgi:hypothetical protein
VADNFIFKEGYTILYYPNVNSIFSAQSLDDNINEKRLTFLIAVRSRILNKLISGIFILVWVTSYFLLPFISADDSKSEAVYAEQGWRINPLQYV